MGKMRKPLEQEHAAVNRCIVQECKKEQVHMSFCHDHYNQFKFGVIKKDGHPVSDYDKKMDHYESYLRRKKVA